MSKGNVFGRPFITTPVLALGVSSLDNLQSGQWVRFAGQKKAIRFVRERETGRNFLVSAPKDGRLSMAAFRLSCGVPTPKVVQEVK